MRAMYPANAPANEKQMPKTSIASAVKKASRIKREYTIFPLRCVQAAYFLPL